MLINLIIGLLHLQLIRLLVPIVQVLKRVMQHEIAESFFNEPVDAEALGIPEYREIIRVRSNASLM
jgi:hypothetical protein